MQRRVSPSGDSSYEMSYAWSVVIAQLMNRMWIDNCAVNEFSSSLEISSKILLIPQAQQPQQVLVRILWCILVIFAILQASLDANLIRPCPLIVTLFTAKFSQTFAAFDRSIGGFRASRLSCCVRWSPQIIQLPPVTPTDWPSVGNVDGRVGNTMVV